MAIIITHFFVFFSMLIFLCLSAFFSGTETAFFSLTSYQLSELQHDNRQSSKLIVFLRNNPSRLLVSVLLGNMTVNILFFCIGAVFVAQIGNYSRGHIWQMIVSAIILLAVIIFGEILPKALGIKKPLIIARLACYPLSAWEFLSTPIRILVMFISSKLEPKVDSSHSQVKPEELTMLVDISKQAGAVNHKTGEMIEDIISLSNLKVKNIMTPRVDVVLCSINKSVKEAIDLAKKYKIFYLPIFAKNKDDVVGFVDTMELYRVEDKNVPVSKYTKTAKFVPETKNAAQLLNEIIINEEKVIFVVDEFGGLAGKITIDDILEEIVGEMHQIPGVSAEGQAEKVAENIFRIDASIPVNDWEDIFHVPLKIPKNCTVSSIGGLFVFLLGKLPKQGDTVTYNGLIFTVKKMKNKRIKTLELRIADCGLRICSNKKSEIRNPKSEI